jgi:hypothetical protein
MPSNLISIEYNGTNDRDMLVKETKSYGSSLKNSWINLIAGVKSSTNIPKILVNGDVYKGYDCDLNSDSQTDYSELKISVFKYMMNYTECNDKFVGTMYEELYANGGLAEMPKEAFDDLIIEPLAQQGAKEFGQAVWRAVQAVTVDNTTPLIQVFDGLEKGIVDVSPNVYATQPAITQVNAQTELDSFITYLLGISDIEDWFMPEFDIDEANYPAIWVSKKHWMYLMSIARSDAFKDSWTLFEDNPFRGLYNGYEIRADWLTDGTLIAGKKDNFHVAIDGQVNDGSSSASLRIDSLQGTNKFKVSQSDSVGTKVVLASQTAIRTVI